MRYIEYDSTDPYFNLAAEEVFFTSRDLPETYFRLWRNDNTIVIGKNQNPYNEINLAFAEENRVKISRRMTGGGAVYHDLGNVNFTFVASADGAAYDFSKFTKPIISALAEMGVRAENSGRNDIEINGGKISGNAQFVSKGRILHHGTLLFDSKLEFIANCLSASSDKLKSHGVSSVRSRVANIKDHLSGGVRVEDFISALKHYIMKEYGCEEISKPSPSELEKIIRLRNAKYATSEWIYGASPEYNFSVQKRFEGCGTINVCANAVGGRFAGCRIYGDFFGTGDVSELEKLLEGTLHDPKALERALSAIDLGAYFNGLTADKFLTLFKL